jgi:hypothetical protein
VILIIAAIWIYWGFGYETVWQRLTVQLDGVVVARQEVSTSSRRGTIYVLRGPDGSDQEYVAGATDASLSRDMPIGTIIKKRKWELSYEKNGVLVDFPTYAYSAIFGIAFACLFWAGLQLLRRSKVEGQMERQDG